MTLAERAAALKAKMHPKAPKAVASSAAPLAPTLPVQPKPAEPLVAASAPIAQPKPAQAIYDAWLKRVESSTAGWAKGWVPMSAVDELMKEIING